MQIDGGFRFDVTWWRSFCGAGVPVAVLRCASIAETAGETPAPQDHTKNNAAAMTNRSGV